MYEEVLREIGLSLNEARVYEAALEIGQASIQALSLAANIHRRNVYDAVAKLLEKGLLSEIFVSGEKHVKAIHPNRLLAILAEKQERVQKLLPQMVAQFTVQKESEEAYMYKGIEGFKNYLQDILNTRETVYFIGAKAFWLDSRLQHFLPQFERERKKRNIEFKHIFDHEVKKQKPEILKLVGKSYKFLPEKYSTRTAIDIFGDYVVTFVGVEPGTLQEEPIQFVMKSKSLAEGYRKWFQFMWDHLK